MFKLSQRDPQGVPVTIAGTVNYDGAYAIQPAARWLWIRRPYCWARRLLGCGGHLAGAFGFCLVCGSRVILLPLLFLALPLGASELRFPLAEVYNLGTNELGTLPGVALSFEIRGPGRRTLISNLDTSGGFELSWAGRIGKQARKFNQVEKIQPGRETSPVGTLRLSFHTTAGRETFKVRVGPGWHRVRIETRHAVGSDAGSVRQVRWVVGGRVVEIGPHAAPLLDSAADLRVGAGGGAPMAVRDVETW